MAMREPGRSHTHNATFEHRIGHTYTLRIYLPQAQAGPGYLDGTSHSQRVGGTV
jgi:hypothetical protein